MQLVIPPVEGSALALALRRIDDGASLTLLEADLDSLLYVVSGSGSFELDGAEDELAAGSAALVLAGESATIGGGGGGIEIVQATVGAAVDRHAPLGTRETVVRLDPERSEQALGTRAYQLLFGPHNGSTRATLFAGFLPPERSPWHYHLYDEIVFVPEGPGRLHLRDSEAELGAGAAFRLRPREVHVVENTSPAGEMTLIGVFTPAGSPSAAYLANGDS
ncbi:MAG: cupin domain-containing protein [Gaiellaceae bacterium]